MKGKEGRLLEEKKGGGVDGWEQVAPTSRGRIVGGGTRSLLSHGRADGDRPPWENREPSSETMSHFTSFVVLLSFDNLYPKRALRKSHFLASLVALYFIPGQWTLTQSFNSG